MHHEARLEAEERMDAMHQAMATQRAQAEREATAAALADMSDQQEREAAWVAQLEDKSAQLESATVQLAQATEACEAARALSAELNAAKLAALEERDEAAKERDEVTDVLSRTKAGLEERLATVETGRSAAVERVQQLQAEAEAAREEHEVRVSALEGELASVREGLGEATGEMQGLGASNAKLNTDLAKANAKVEELGGELASLKESEATLLGEVDSLGAQIEILESDAENMSEEIEVRGAAADEAVKGMVTAEARIQQLDAEVVELETELVQTTAALQQTRDEMSALEGEVVKSEAGWAARVAEMAQTRESERTAEAAAAAAKEGAAVETVRAEAARDLEGALEELTDKHTELMQVVEETHTTRVAEVEAAHADELEAHLEEAEQEKVELEETHARMLQATEDRAAAEAEAAEGELVAFRAKMAKKEAEAAEVVVGLEAHLKALGEERDALEASADRQRSEAQQELAVASAKATKLGAELRQVHEQVTAHSWTIESKSQRITTLEEELAREEEAHRESTSILEASLIEQQSISDDLADQKATTQAALERASSQLEVLMLEQGVSSVRLAEVESIADALAEQKAKEAAKTKASTPQKERAAYIETLKAELEALREANHGLTESLASVNHDQGEGKGVAAEILEPSPPPVQRVEATEAPRRGRTSVAEMRRANRKLHATVQSNRRTLASIKVNAPRVSTKDTPKSEEGGADSADGAGAKKGKAVWGSSRGTWGSRPGDSAKKVSPATVAVAGTPAAAKPARGRTPAKSSSVKKAGRSTTPSTAAARRVRSMASPSPRGDSRFQKEVLSPRRLR